DLHARVKQHVRNAAVMGVACLIVAYLLSRLLGSAIARPIYGLAWVARLVASGKDYSLRVQISGGGDVRQLGADFNHMLEEIQRRDAALHEAREVLEKRVEERTQELQEVIELRRRAEEELRERTIMLDKLIEVSPLALVVTTSDARIRLANA